LIRGEITQRLGARGQLAAPALSAPNEATVRRFEKHVEARRGSFLAPQRGVLTPVVAAFIALNIAMFLAEIWLGGATNSFALHRLGALTPYDVLARGEYWRLIAALFLHFGSVHLLVNCYALYVIGPPLESSIGAVRFALSYILAGLGSTIGVVALWRFNWTEADFLVGASGSVMGIVGVWAGLLLRHHNAPTARKRLASIGLIVAIQTTFDAMTPQVSMAAHLCGFASGVILGLLLAPREARPL
jgi:rhomboid protease GluP